MTTNDSSEVLTSKPKVNKRGPYIITSSIIEFLSASDEPRHITEIYDYIKNIVPVTQKNIGTILYNSNSDRFVLFTGRFYGLKEKNYSPEALKLTVFNRSDFTREVYKTFAGWDFEKVIQHYHDALGYRPTQARYYLNKSIRRGVLKLQPDNTISV